MEGIVELKQEVARLKRRLEKEEEQHNEKDDLLSKLNKKLKVKETEFDLMKLKVTKQDEMLRQVSDKIECPVCMEMPRSGPVPVCPNGHFVRKTCKADSCPTCRTAMGDGGKSLLATTILEKSEHNCKFENCDKKFPLADIEKHEEVCVFRAVNCLHQMCNARVSLLTLSDHLFKSKQCWQLERLSENSEDWSTRTFTINQEIQAAPSISWLVSMYSFSGEVFAVFPNKCGGQFYIQVVMFADKNECSKFRFEVVVHEEGTTVSDSRLAVRFDGEPLSIDLKKGDLNLFGTSEKLMVKLLEKSKNKTMFNLSFKILKV